MTAQGSGTHAPDGSTLSAPATPDPKGKRSSYVDWLHSEGIPVVEGLAVEDLAAVPVERWERLGVRGAFVRLRGAEDTNDAFVMEIPPGQSTKVDRHLYEKFIFVLEGNGTCEVWNGAGARSMFEWKAGSLFSIPLNCSHVLHNSSGSNRVRLAGVTTAPIMINLLHNLEFVFGCSFDFTDRFAGEEGYFDGQGELFPGRVWETNFVPDAYRFKLYEWKERGAGGTNIMLELANNSLCSHISEFPVGTYEKGHLHGPGAHIIILSGEGYTLMWPRNDHGQEPDFHRIPWKAGSMLVPPGGWFHQHFNIGSEPARYLPIRWGSRRWSATQYLDVQGGTTSVKEGGNQIEYEDQHPWIHELFVESCRQKGVDVVIEHPTA